ncbi:MAG: hypothetical protein K0Q79_2366 [Flavipsychrobacter sp.]|nr:hypothetical protein [Flavipsychrobacter sp.]
MSARPILILLLITAVYAVQAQRTTPGRDTVLKGSTIEVIQSYKPQVKQAPKPEYIPQLPPADTAHPTFSYDVPQQSLYYTYSSMPLRPLALGRETVKLPFQNYVKIGGGNLSTLYFDAGIGGIHGKGFESNIHLHHISQQGDIKHQQSSLSGLEAEGTIHSKSTDWRISLAGARNQYNYYGYNHALYIFPDDSVQQTFMLIRAGIDVKNGAASKSKLIYNPSIKAGIYNAAFGTSETSANLSLPFEYHFDNAVQALLTASADYAHLETRDTGRDNTLAGVTPGIRIRLGEFTGTALVGFAFGTNSAQYILPDIKLSYKIPGSQTTFIAGMQYSVRQNTYEQLTTENTYIINTYTILQTRRDEYYAGMQARAGAHFTFSGRISYWNFKGLPTYLNDSGVAGDGRRQFNIVYDTVDAISFQLAARYKKGNKWSAGVSAQLYNFTNGTQLYVWHEPTLRIRGDFSAKLFSKLNVSVYLSVLDGIYARDFATHNPILLDPVLDVGGNAEYQIVPRLSAFVQLNNIFNNNYQRWYGYDAYGINIYGGLRLKF